MEKKTTLDDTNETLYGAVPARHTRLLKLEPGNGDEPLRAELCDMALDSIVDCDALSYCWGIPIFSQVLRLGQKQLRIIDSLKDALSVLRYHDNPRLLWVDQVCINQNDIEEKVQQVGLMAEIVFQLFTRPSDRIL